MMNLKYIFIAALVVLASCQVEEHEEKNDANVDVTFVARNEAKVKTTLNEDDKVLWDEEDQIAILWDGGSVMSEARLGTDRSVAEFTARVPAGKDYYAVYPYSDELSLTTAGIAVEVPHSQSGTFAGANITVAKADKQNNLTFKHVVGYVEFTTQTAGIVEFSGADNDVLAGVVSISGFDAEGVPHCSFREGQSNITVHVNEPGTYYMAVVPCAELNGFTIRMITDGISKSASYDQKIVIGRGKLLPLGDITERLKRDGQIDSFNEKFDITDIFDEVTGICVPNAVSMDSDLSYLPESVSTLQLTVSSPTPLTSIRLTSLEYISGIMREGAVAGDFTLVQGSKSLTVNCTGQSATSFTLPIKLLPKVNGEIKLRMCDADGLMSETKFNVNINAGETVSQSVTHSPDADLLFFEGFDRCVWGGDIMAESKGFSPADGKPDKTMTGSELPIYVVPSDTPGSEMIHSKWHATDPVTGTSELTPEYLASRGFDAYRQMLRVHEYDGYIAVGTSVLTRGYVETLPMKALGDMKSVVVKFRVCPMPGCVETIRFDVEKAGVVKSVKVDGKDVSTKSCWHEKVTSRAVMGADVVSVPLSYADAKWHDVEVRIENVNEATIFSWYPATDKSQVNGFYLDEISIEKAKGWDYQSGKDLRVLYWNIQNGMFADQANGYENFAQWVKSYNPDICVWTEGMTTNDTGASAFTLGSDVAAGSGWATLAGRYGHKYLAIAHRNKDDYPQVVTSRYPIETLVAIGRIILADDIYHAAALHQIDMEGTKVNLITLHLKPDLNGENNSEYRQYELEYIFNKTILKSQYASENYIVAGDFNSRTPLDAAYYTSATQAEYDVHNYLYSKTNLVDVIADRYPNRFMATTLGSRIDFVYLSPALNSKVTDAAIVCDAWVKANLPTVEIGELSYRDPSDHRPILVNIRMK